MKHSDSYNDPLGGPSGENLYWASWKAAPEKSVTAWYEEVKDCGPMPGCKVGHDWRGWPFYSYDLARS